MSKLLYDFLQETATPQPMVIHRGVLPRAGKCVLGGAPKAGKSFIALNMALDMARGRHIFSAHYNNGTPVMPCTKKFRVLYFEQEIGPDGLRDRLHAMLKGELDPSIELFIKSRDMQMRLDMDSGRELIAAECAEVKPDVVIFDPLAKFHLYDENSAQQMGAVMRAGDKLVEKFGTAIIYIHHTAKPGAEDNKRGGDRLRGSSAVFADVDTLILVDRQGASNVREPVIKLEMELRRGEPIESIYLKRNRHGICEYIGETNKERERVAPIPVAAEYPEPSFKHL